MEVQTEKRLTANQLYKQYKEDGGVLNFSEWLNREKTKGIFPLNGSVNEEISKALANNKQTEMQNKTILGFPVSVLVVTGVIIVGAFVAYKYMKK